MAQPFSAVHHLTWAGCRRLEAFQQDVRFAAKSLVKARAFSWIVIVTLALGIGTNTAVFSVLHAAARQLRASALDPAGGRRAAPAHRVRHTRIPNGTQIPEGAQQRVIAGDYFAAMGIPLLRGRVFQPSDDENAPRRVVISKGVADRLFPVEDPIGRSVRAGGANLEVIGIVGDVSITYRTPPRPTVYHLHRQFAANRNWALVKVVSLDPHTRSAVDAIGGEVRTIDPALVRYQPRTLRAAIGGGLAQERFALFLVGLFAALAVTLAAIGLYGVLSYSVARRHREIGIRLALGAPAASIRALILRDGGMLAVTASSSASLSRRSARA
jgi:hypothetical protein